MEAMKTRDVRDSEETHTRTTSRMSQREISSGPSLTSTQSSILTPNRTPASTTRPGTSLQGKLQIKASRKFGALIGLS